MKNLIKIIKIIHGNKKYKAMFQLSLYLLFFMFIVIILNISNSVPNDVKVLTPLEQYNEMSDYSFEITITKDLEIYNMSGICSNNICYLTDYDISYAYDDLINDSINIGIDLNEITVKSIYNKISNLEPVSTTTRHDTNEIENDYQVDTYLISTYEIDDKIYKVEIDYYNTIENYTSYIVNIIYS